MFIKFRFVIKFYLYVSIAFKIKSLFTIPEIPSIIYPSLSIKYVVGILLIP